MRLTKKFIELKEEVVKEIPAADQKLYGDYPVYYLRGDQESFNQSKDQLIFLLDKIIAENLTALEVLNVFQENLIKLTINNEEDVKEPILIDLKKRFESLYYYNRHLLEKIRVGQFNDLTLGVCYQGAYSNAVMLIDRVIAGGGLSNYLLSAKREIIQQYALNFLSKNNIATPNIHSVNSLYNHVASSYNMQIIPDSFASDLGHRNFNRFARYLRESITPLVLLRLVQSKFVIPKEYNSQLMAEILPEHLQQDWMCALYDTKGQAHDLERTSLLLLKVILQELGFIEELVKKVPVNVEEGMISFYQTGDDILIQECIDDEEFLIDRFIIRVCNNSEKDYQLVESCYQTLKERPLSLKGLPQGVILKLLETYQEDAFSLIKVLIEQSEEIPVVNMDILQSFLGKLAFLKAKDSEGESILAVALSRAPSVI
ncbi:hypothetical protein [Piscirickettsia salmonis]|uniref:hypothetical protein n=1 Tax=Piscirickettsia salmonis TaxID=1238 RepID=UPI003A80EBC3